MLMNPVQSILIGTVQLYRWTLSPVLAFCLGPYARCRFTPSCSLYAVEAIRTHGAARGGWLAARRLLSCHPLGRTGFDPVPARRLKGSV